MTLEWNAWFFSAQSFAVALQYALLAVASETLCDASKQRDTNQMVKNQIEED